MVSGYMWHISGNLCSQNMVSIILIALTAHHTPSIILSGTSLFNMGFSADRNLLFWEFPYLMEWKKASLLNITGVRSHPPAYSPWMYQFTKFSYCRNCILLMCPTKHVLLERVTAATTTTVLTCSTRACVCGTAADRKRRNKECLTKWCPYCLTLVSWPVMRSSFTIYFSAFLFKFLNSYTFYMYVFVSKYAHNSLHYPYSYALSSVPCVNIYGPVFNAKCFSVLLCFASVFKVRCLINEFYSLSFVVCHTQPPCVSAPSFILPLASVIFLTI